MTVHYGALVFGERWGQVSAEVVKGQYVFCIVLHQASSLGNLLTLDRTRRWLHHKTVPRNGRLAGLAYQARHEPCQAS